MLGVEELEALVLEVLEAPWFRCLEELEALVWLNGLEDLVLFGQLVPLVAPRLTRKTPVQAVPPSPLRGITVNAKAVETIADRG